MILTIINILSIQANAYENHCYNCGSRISSDFCQRCNSCGWYVCVHCYSCGCKNSVSNNNQSKKETLPTERIVLLLLIAGSLYSLIYAIPKLSSYITKKANPKKEENSENKPLINNRGIAANPSPQQPIHSHLQKSNFTKKPTIGEMVSHHKFGYGIIEEIDEKRDRIKIVFGSTKKEFMLSNFGKYFELLN